MRRFFVGLAITAMLGMIPGQARGNDRQISQAIVKKLQAEQKNKNLNGFNIDLEVDEGTVYLKGSVSSDEQEKLTLDIVRRIEGVTQVYNELEIIPTAKSESSSPTKDEPADEPVELEPVVTAKPIEKTESVEQADVSSQTEALGQADKEERAEIVEEATPKVNGILSSLRKARPISTHRPEPAPKPVSRASAISESESNSRDLAERIIARLKQEKATGRLQGFAIDVEVDKGVAWINGKVTTPEQQNRVLDTVRRVPGVKQVVNGLSVTEPAKTPTDIAQQIVSQLHEKKASGELKNFSVDVEVDHGVVWLSGQAANDSQQQLILDTARYIPGVTKVVNDLVVKAPVVSKPQLATAKAAIDDQDSESLQLPPLPLPSDDEPIGSAVASGAHRGSSNRISQSPAPVAPAPFASAQPAQRAAAPALQSPDPSATKLQTANSGQPRVQYMWVPANQMPATAASSQTPLAFAPANAASHSNMAGMAHGGGGQPVPINASVPGTGIAPARFDHPQMPQYSWPSYAPYPNYGAVTYPKQYSPMAWPYIGPFYPYPQVPLGWRKVELKWKDGWWQLDFKDRY